MLFSTVSGNNIDTTVVPCLKIRNHAVKNTLCHVLREEEKDNQKCYMVISFVTINDEDYILIGCDDRWGMKYYLLLDEVKTNPFIGCCKVHKKVCFIFGENTRRFFTNTDNVAVFVDEFPFISFVQSKNFDYKTIVFNESTGTELLHHPHVYVFHYSKKRNKFIRFNNDSFYLLYHTRQITDAE